VRTIPKITIATVSLALMSTGGLYAVNHTQLQQPLDQVISTDSRNSGIVVRAHYAGYLPGGTLVYDLRDPGRGTSAADVFRVFLQYAEAVKHRRFDRVELAFRGETKFVLDGASFRTIGVEYADQNPIFTIRTFPEKLRTPDGRAAFEKRDGGLLVVTTEQMNDFGEFNRRWYGAAL
jgi:hypothetical protein